MRKHKLYENLGLLLFSLVVGFIFTTSVAAKTVEKDMQQRISDNILRFHILANSDDDEDQAIKLVIRDAIMSYLADDLSQSDSLETSKQLVSQQLDDITALADQILQENGYDITANSRLTYLYFPEITYGDMTVPAGYYTALQVRLGEAAGHNWWCVMYPMLCFVDEAAKPTDDLENLMHDILTEDEYNTVFNVKFKSLELLNQ